MSDVITTTSARSGLPSAPTDDLLRFVLASLSTSTRRNYAAQLKLWIAHCATSGLTPFPAAPVDVANWIAGRV